MENFLSFPELISSSKEIFATASAAIAIGAVVVTVASAIKSGIIKQLRFGSIELEFAKAAREFESVGKKEKAEGRPFETAALENYYKHALSRANISFWFSLIFASIGFGVIIFAFASHEASDLGGTVVKVVSGTVIDSVSALFFVQSTNAQKSMSEFFEKLRLDRLNVEAREMIGEIENRESRDQLRAQLVLKYSGIDKLLVGSDGKAQN